jgi:ABC-type transport system substrate-binding protein
MRLSEAVIVISGRKGVYLPKRNRAGKDATPRSRMARVKSTTLSLFLLAALVLAALAQAADPKNVIRYASPSAESKLDPAAESDEASGSISHVIFDPLLTYDFLARPAKLKPNTAVALPEVGDDGATYTIRIKPGIQFTPDAAFGGQKRELTAYDYVYSIKRLFDPKLKSQWLFMVEGKVKGGDAAMKAAKQSGRFDFDAPMEGLQALDRYTIRIKLVTGDYSFPFVLAMPCTAALAREVVEKYGEDVAAHPVGTGPFYLKEWIRGSRVVLEANPGYRDDYYEGDPGPDEASRAIHARLKGRKLPIVGRIEINTVDEAQPRWLSFLNGETEYIRPVPEEFAHVAMPGGRIAPHLAKKGFYLTPDEIAYTTYTTLNTAEKIGEEPNALGGFSPERVALRRAIAMAWRIDEQILILDKNQSTRAHTPLPPAVSGHDPQFVSPTLEYNPAKAKALLDMFGFIDRDGDGYRENPDGTPLSFDHASIPTSRERQRSELWKKSMDDIGIRVTFNQVDKLPSLRKQALLGRVQSFSYGWIADFPDGENFLQLLWKGSIGQVNYAMFDHPEYNALYEKIKRMPDSPERNAIMAKMVKLILVYAPWVVETYKAQNILVAPWVLGYKKHPFNHEPWKYLDIDLERFAKR